MSLMTMGAAAWRRTQGDDPPGPPEFDPSVLAGLTFAVWPGSSDMYTTSNTASGSPVADGDGVGRIDSIGGISRVSSGGSGLLKPSAFGPGRPGVRFSGYGLNLSTLAPRPPDGMNTTGSVALPDLFGATSKLVLWAGVIDNISNNSGSVDTNDYLIAAANGYMGLHAFKVGGAAGTDVRLQWYNYPSNYHTITADVPVGTPFVAACRHKPGSPTPHIIEIAVNSVAWNSRNSAATGSMSGYLLPTPYPRNGVGSGFDVTMAALVICDDPNEDADILTVVKQMGTLVGLSL